LGQAGRHSGLISKGADHFFSGPTVDLVRALESVNA
jgi:hypothetical protein